VGRGVSFPASDGFPLTSEQVTQEVRAVSRMWGAAIARRAPDSLRTLWRWEGGVFRAYLRHPEADRWMRWRSPTDDELHDAVCKAAAKRAIETQGAVVAPEPPPSPDQSSDVDGCDTGKGGGFPFADDDEGDDRAQPDPQWPVRRDRMVRKAGGVGGWTRPTAARKSNPRACERCWGELRLQKAIGPKGSRAKVCLPCARLEGWA